MNILDAWTQLQEAKRLHAEAIGMIVEGGEAAAAIERDINMEVATERLSYWKQQYEHERRTEVLARLQAERRG